MATLRQVLGGHRRAVVDLWESCARAGEQLASPGPLAAVPHQQWNAQVQVLIKATVDLLSVKEKDRLKILFTEKGWHAPINNDEDRARQVAVDAAAMNAVITALREGQSNFEHRLACAEVESLLNSFEAIARRLGKRRDGRDPLVVHDEYDVQYLLHALLASVFQDVRMEEAVGSHAGANSRIDFLLKAERIAIEVKATRESLDDQQLGRELLEDSAKYKNHPGVQTLYFFIWDAHHHIRNAAGIRSDVKQEAGERPVHVIFSPPRR